MLPRWLSSQRQTKQAETAHRIAPTATGAPTARVRQNHLEEVAVLAQRQDMIVLEKAQGDAPFRHRRLWEVRGLRQGQIQDLCQGLGQVALRNQPKAHQHAQDGIAAILRQAAGTPVLGMGELVASLQQGHHSRLDAVLVLGWRLDIQSNAGLGVEIRIGVMVGGSRRTIRISPDEGLTRSSVAQIRIAQHRKPSLAANVVEGSGAVARQKIAFRHAAPRQ